MVESRPRQSGPSNLTLRILSAVTLAPLVILALWFGGWVFVLMIVTVGVLGYFEWVRISLTAAGRASSRCVARHTSPIPPCPSRVKS